MTQTVSNIIAGARKVPVTVVDMASYRQRPTGAPRLIVETLASLITRAWQEPEAQRRESIDTAAHLVKTFGPPLAEDSAKRFADAVDACWDLLERHAPSVERDAEIRREACWLLGVA